MTFTIGNTEGKYFSQWRFDHLKELAELLTGEHFGLNVENPHLYYDDREDFHYLQCRINGHVVKVRYYKVYALVIDGQEKEEWPVRSQWSVCQRIRDRTRLLIPASPLSTVQ